MSDPGEYTLLLTPTQVEDAIDSLEDLYVSIRNKDLVPYRIKFHDEEGYMGSDIQIIAKYKLWSLK